jgi:hypothetical protein
MAFIRTGKFYPSILSPIKNLLLLSGLGLLISGKLSI